MQKKYKKYYKKYKMVELSYKNDICIGMKYVFGFFRFFRIFFKKMQMLNYSKQIKTKCQKC
jgi:Na+-translocating ferredoxin:NAD+ oxidoreductase RNF subunit RnfB